MISAGTPSDLIQKKLNILRKYSFGSYVKNNIKLLKSNPKKYHKCLQNILKWNVEIGQEMGIEEQSDLDCSQVYQGKDGSIHYGSKAKLQAQEEWEDEYLSRQHREVQRFSDEEIATIDKSITDEELVNAVNRLKQKGLAWDYIAHWVPKMLIRFAPVEIVMIYRKLKLLNGNYSEDCVDVEGILSQFNHLYDEDYNRRMHSKKYYVCQEMPDLIQKVIDDNLSGTNYDRQLYSLAGMALLRRCLKMEMKTAVHQTGRLFLM